MVCYSIYECTIKIEKIGFESGIYISMKVDLNMHLTTSKVVAFLILIIGSVFSYMYQDGGTLIATFSAVSAVLMLKTYTQSRTYQKQIEYRKNEDEIG